MRSYVGIQALVRALNISLDITYLDQSSGSESGEAGRQGSTEVNLVHFEAVDSAPSNGSQTDLPFVLLLRPGHYDILLKQ